MIYTEIQIWLKETHGLDVLYSTVFRMVKYQLKVNLKVPRPCAYLVASLLAGTVQGKNFIVQGAFADKGQPTGLGGGAEELLQRLLHQGISDLSHG